MIPEGMWDQRVTFREVDPATGARHHERAGVRAFCRADPVNGLRWNLSARDLGVIPKMGDELVEPGGRVVVVCRVGTAEQGSRYVCHCAAKGV